eukprot:1157065-Pelagomonas_calceolata.AAC.23
MTTVGMGPKGHAWFCGRESAREERLDVYICIWKEMHTRRSYMCTLGEAGCAHIHMEGNAFEEKLGMHVRRSWIDRRAT